MFWWLSNDMPRQLAPLPDAVSAFPEKASWREALVNMLMADKRYAEAKAVIRERLRLEPPTAERHRL